MKTTIFCISRGGGLTGILEMHFPTLSMDHQYQYQDAMGAIQHTTLNVLL